MTQNQKYPLESRTEAVSRDALVQAALQEITQNYREASLSNVARAYGVSLAYVSECVRAQTGKTYKELLQRHRMETAARLLRRSDLNIQQIIAQVGYENTSFLCIGTTAKKQGTVRLTPVPCSGGKVILLPGMLRPWSGCGPRAPDGTHGGSGRSARGTDDKNSW